MVLEVIYVVRHGYRSNWVVNTSTGVYTTSIPSPTNIASDPALAAYGVDQARQLASKIVTLDPPVDVVYSSPFYRCLQTLGPTVEALKEKGRGMEDGAGKGGEGVRVENGISEFFGTARFTHPAPAPLSVLHNHFPYLSASHKPAIKPAANGETLSQLQNRFAYALDRIITSVDSEPTQPRAILLCTHAAGMICIGRALTGKMPEDVDEADFGCGTCALSVFVRRKESQEAENNVDAWDENRPEVVPSVDWIGKGVKGGWECVVNGDCTHLEGGEERTWTFRMEQSHPGNKAPVQAGTGVNSTGTTTSSVGPRRQSVTSVLETPLSLRSTNSLPTPTPNTVTIMEDVDDSNEEETEMQELDNSQGATSVTTNLLNFGVGPGTKIDWAGTEGRKTEMVPPRKRGSSDGSHPSVERNGSSSMGNGRRPSLKERILSATAEQGRRESGPMTTHLEEDVIV